MVANALLGLQRAMIDYVRYRVGTGPDSVAQTQAAQTHAAETRSTDLGGLAADVRKLTAEAFALLEHGLAGYAAKP